MKNPCWLFPYYGAKGQLSKHPWSPNVEVFLLYKFKLLFIWETSVHEFWNRTFSHLLFQSRWFLQSRIHRVCGFQKGNRRCFTNCQDYFLFHTALLIKFIPDFLKLLLNKNYFYSNRSSILAIYYCLTNSNTTCSIIILYLTKCNAIKERLTKSWEQEEGKKWQTTLDELWWTDLPTLMISK